ncbi:unnamed protein product [Allacma fusca]|uniref:Uncharacterized protein n=1 Tax=Allacma fusca TaxID=39272 RepID=A0A8J2K4U0_9HEXA|nr:unnamed protein product [Allacma fusca]
MDASNEFRFIATGSGASGGGKKKSKKMRSDQIGTHEDSSDRNVPVCVTNSNRNVKLRFVWDKAFKLFQSHRTVYKAISGINYQDYRTGGSSSSIPPPSSTGLSVNSRSFSHSHLNGIGREVEMMPGGSMGREQALAAASALNGRTTLNKLETEQVSVIVPRKKKKTKSSSSVVHGGGGVVVVGSGSYSAASSSTTASSSPSSSSGGGSHSQSWSPKRPHHHPSHQPTAVHVRRSQSTKSASCHSNSDCNRSRGSASGSCTSVGGGGSSSHSNSAHPLYDHVPSSTTPCLLHGYYPNSSYGSREPSPFPENCGLSKCSRATCDDYYNNTNSEDLNNSPCDNPNLHCDEHYCTCEGDCELDTYGHDSGLDTWKTPTPSHNNTTKEGSVGRSGNWKRQSGGGGGQAIVCTISQKIPNRDPSNELSTRKDGNSGGGSSKNDKMEPCKCINGSTTVVLISEAEKSAQDSPLANSNSNSGVGGEGLNGSSESQGDNHNSQSVGYFLSDYDLECMSEIDLNSDSGSSSASLVAPDEQQGVVRDLPMILLSSPSTTAASSEAKMKFSPLSSVRLAEASLELLENELDSLDLTLFETSREKEKTFLQALQEMDMDLHDCESHLYDTVTDSINSSATTPGNKESLYWNWSDAGSEFEFMTPANVLNRDIPLGHSPRGHHPEIDWEPYFCVLNQLDQTFTSYRSEEMSVSQISNYKFNKKKLW